MNAERSERLLTSCIGIQNHGSLIEMDGFNIAFALFGSLFMRIFSAKRERWSGLNVKLCQVL